jgi:hypothetical protein
MTNSKYFKPYKHPTSNLTFYENSLYRPGLYDIAIGEQKRAFPIRNFSNPDIFLSLGSGYESERRDSAQSSPIAEDRSSRNTDEASRESWHIFLYSLPSETVSNQFVRIDPAIAHLPAQDDPDSLEIIQTMSKSYFDTEEIRKLALELFARLFYFDEKEKRDEVSDDENSLQGTIIPSMEWLFDLLT